MNFITQLRRYRWIFLGRRKIKKQIDTLPQNQKLKIILGSAETKNDGWISTDIPHFNILKKSDWEYFCGKHKIDNLLAEHVLEHLRENSTEEPRVLGAKIKEVRQLIREKKWCKEVHIIESEKNKGIGNSVIDGVTEIVNKYGKIIVLEDDLVLAKGFLKYMNDALSLYENEEGVMHISGYMFPVKAKLPETFFLNTTTSWGWATWSRSWKYFNDNSIVLWEKISKSGKLTKFNLENSFYADDLLFQNAEYEKSFSTFMADKNSSKWNWDICWYASVFLQNGFCLHPNKSLLRNIGHDDEGVHCKKSWWSEIYNSQEIVDNMQVKPIDLKESEEARKAVKQFYERLGNPPLWVRAKEKMKLILNK